MATKTFKGMNKSFRQLCVECRRYAKTVYSQENYKEYMLLFILTNKHDDCLNVLLEAGVDVNWIVYSKTPLMAAIVDDYVYGVKRLIHAGADVNRRNEGDGTPVPLIWAGYEGRDECIELLLNAGADVNAHTGGPYKQYTALHAAVEAGNITTVELLLKAGPDLNKEGWLYYRFTALSLALKHGYDEAVKLLIQTGADVNKVPERENSSVMPIRKQNACNS